MSGKKRSPTEIDKPTMEEVKSEEVESGLELQAPEPCEIQWIMNVKHRGQRYKAGQTLRITPDEAKELAAAKVARLVD
ncbi:DUF7210 family protein [Desulfotomaculum sp. 1211_IL3151]|uniref:DUF7210 family protein n=1 Tax=Desulfotomaculum sp. 1211_IL3151 TaxID=3084055 RepID=UPI002FDB695C